jgi:hypothetical protein
MLTVCFFIKYAFSTAKLISLNGRILVNAKLSKMWNEAIIALARVYCHDLEVTIDGVLDWVIGFIDTLYIHLGTTGSASAISTHFKAHRYPRTRILSLH